MWLYVLSIACIFLLALTGISLLVLVHALRRNGELTEHNAKLELDLREARWLNRSKT